MSAFEDVRRNDPTVSRWVDAWEKSHSVPEVEMLKMCIVCLVGQKRELADKLSAMSLLVPRRCRLPDGTFRVLHIPDEFIPVTEAKT